MARLAMIALAAGALNASPAGAQLRGGGSLAERIATVRDGSVQLTYTARAGVCGDGEEYVSFGRNRYTVGRWRDGERSRSCDPGPVRVTIIRDRGETLRLVTRVGGRPRAGSDVRDLGEVPAPEAARWMLAQVETLGGKPAQEALAAAVYADSTEILPSLARIARSDRLSRDTRQAALFWISAVDEPGGDRILRDVLLDVRENLEIRKQALFWLAHGNLSTRELVSLYERLPERGLHEHFTFVLSQRGDREATEKLIDIAQHDDDRDVRRQAFFWLGQSKDPRARAFLREVVLR
jgi:hypothetical protein